MWDFISHYNQNEFDFNRARGVVSIVTDIKFRKRKEMALISTISANLLILFFS